MARILVCDDDAGIRDLLDVALAMDHDVILSANGRDALETLGRVKGVDLVVLDVMMPDLDGFETLRRIRRDEHLRDLPVIMLTARVSEDDYLSAFRHGADAYVSKPFDPDDLEHTIGEVMARSPERRREVRDAERHKASLLRQLENRFT